MLVNQNTFDLKSTITDDWGGSHQVVIDLEALANVEDWKIGVELPNNYQIDQVYGAQLTQENGKTYISGVDWNEDLNTGEKTKIVLIVDEENSHDTPPIAPKLFFADTVDNFSLDNSEQLSGAIDFNSYVVEDWQGGYKVELDISAQSNIRDWEIDFSLPYSLRGVYGVDLVDNGNGNYTISGQNDQVDLQQGQSIKPIFIIDDYNQQAIAPEATAIRGETAAATITTPKATPEPEAPLTPVTTPKATPEPEAPLTPITTPEATPEPEAPLTPITTPEATPEPNPQYGRGRDLIAQPEAGGKTIDVEQDFGGNLENAIASANDGDVVSLGNKTYYTNGITIDKDITLDGQQGSIINGNNTSEAIITLNSTAGGATIQDIEITNGSIGIYGYKVFDLTIQNIDVNNIGIDNTNRNGQYNTGIVLNGADGLRLLDSSFDNLGRKGIGVNDTDGATISGIKVENVNLAAQHAQSHDAAGIKFFNTNDIIVKDSYFSDINAMFIWNDTTINTSIVGNVMVDVGEDFQAPSFNNNVDISGIYNEKSAYSIVKDNYGTDTNGKVAYRATEFTTETMVMENNDFSTVEINTTDYWVNESVEKRIALTEDPDEADFSLFADEYFAQTDVDY